MRALQIAATGMSAQQMWVEVISNNLANMSTTGFNPRRAEFSDLHYQQMVMQAWQFLLLTCRRQPALSLG